MRALRYIIFIPLIFIIIAIVYNILPISLFYIMTLSKFWLIFLLIFFGGTAIGIFQFLPGGLSWLSSKISPNKNFAFYSILITSILLGIFQIYSYWTIQNTYEDGFGTFLRIMLTCLTIGFATSFSVGAKIEMLEQNSSAPETLLSLGALIFNTGIFLAFCLLTTKLCNINSDETYYWYSGIWHGIFVIPNWVLSWFTDDIYCKAPNSTTAYNIWWWISFIFIGLGILGKSNNRY